MLRGTSSYELGRGMRSKGLRGGSVVLDVGEAYTKCGFTGESSPRFVLPTTFSFVEQKFVTRGVGAVNGHDWKAILLKFFKNIYFQHLQVTPSDRRVLVCENPFWPFAFKKALADALFELEVPSLFFLPKAALPLYLSNKDSGLIVDVGYMETRVLPVSDGFPAQNVMKTSPVGMVTVHTAMQEQVEELKALSAEALDDVVARTCFVAPSGEGAECKDVALVTVSGERITVPGRARFGGSASLFGGNEDEYNIAAIVLDAVATIPLDARPLVIDNVVLSGGTTMLPGFSHRLLQEIDELLGNAKYSQLAGLKGKFRLCSSPIPAYLHHYVGAALVGSIGAGDDHFFTKEHLEEGGRIPDWTTSHLDVAEGGELEEDEPRGGDYLIF